MNDHAADVKAHIKDRIDELDGDFAVLIIRPDEQDNVALSAYFDPVVPRDLDPSNMTDTQQLAMTLVAVAHGRDAESPIEVEDKRGHRRTLRPPTPDEQREFSDAHAEGLHDDLPREGCPECKRRNGVGP